MPFIETVVDVGFNGPLVPVLAAKLGIRCLIGGDGFVGEYHDSG